MSAADTTRGLNASQHVKPAREQTSEPWLKVWVLGRLPGELCTPVRFNSVVRLMRLIACRSLQYSRQMGEERRSDQTKPLLLTRLGLLKACFTGITYRIENKRRLYAASFTRSRPSCRWAATGGRAIFSKYNVRSAAW